MQIKTLASRFARDQKGASLVEYIILVGVVALLSVVAFQQFGSAVQNKINQEGSSVGQIQQ